MTRLLPLLLFVALATAGSAQTSASFSADDTTMETSPGKYYDEYALSLSAGDQVSIEMSSEAVDTYLYLMTAANGFVAQNDDCTQGDYNKSCITTVIEDDGEYKVTATTYDPRETGAYEIMILVNGEPVF